MKLELGKIKYLRHYELRNSLSVDIYLEIDENGLNRVYVDHASYYYMSGYIRKLMNMEINVWI